MKKRWILFIIIIILIIIALTWYIIYKILFFPSQIMKYRPDDGKYEDLYLKIGDCSGRSYHQKEMEKEKEKSKDKYINVWYFNSFPNKKIILFFHGNSGNISERDYIIDICNKFKLNLLLVDYRGFGNSDGIPSITGIFQDGLTAYSFLRTRHIANKIIVWGESLGGSVAIYVASKRKCKCLILLSTFACLEDIVYNYKFLSWTGPILGFLIQSVVEPIPSKIWINNISCPVAIIHSKDDEIIPPINGKILYQSVKHVCKIYLRIRGKHASPKISEEQFEKIFKFADINTNICSSKVVKKIIDNLEKVADNNGLIP